MEPKLDAEPKDHQSNSDKNLDDSTTRTSLETTWKVGEDLQARTGVIWWIQMKGYKYNNNNHPYQIHQMQTILYPSIRGTIWTLKLLLLLIQMRTYQQTNVSFVVDFLGLRFPSSWRDLDHSTSIFTPRGLQRRSKRQQMYQTILEPSYTLQHRLCRLQTPNPPTRPPLQ